MAETVAPSPHVPRRVVVAGLLLLVLLGLLLSSMALFNTQTRATGSSIGTGTVDIAAAPATVVLGGLDLAPGEVVAGTLDLANVGALELRYAITSTTTEDVLAGILQLTIRTAVADCSPAGVDLTGTTVAGPVPLGSTAGEPVLGDPAQGADAGDRTLGPGLGETLCVKVELPAAADDDDTAERTTTATLRIDAEQTVANP